MATVAVAVAGSAEGKAKSSKPSAIPPAVRRAMDRAEPNEIKAHTRFLSDDALEGRGPGTRGDDLAVSYIASRLEAAGLEPAGENGTWYQPVPLIGILTDPQKTSLSLTPLAGGNAMPLRYLEDYTATDQTQSASNTLDSELIFVGHGVVAPEYNWDDYKGVDVRGKTIVMLVDDPPASATEPELFKGKARTYYGRWTYKYEIAAQKGATGAILVHTKDAAGYVWDVVRNSWGRERSYLKVKQGEPALRIASWLTEPAAQSLMKAGGHDLAALTSKAHTREFRPVPLNYKITGSIASTVRPFNTRNVLGRIRGSDRALGEEAVLYTAHHDHLGIGKAVNGDAIYNGAVDNATGVAVVLEMARMWKLASPAPKRTLIFNFVAAEEQGLLGSAWYGQNPTIPAGRIALNLNFDSVGQLGRVRNATMNGVERTTFHPTALRVTKALGMRIDPDEHPEQGYYYRSDHFSLGKVGVPAFSVDAGSEVIGQTKEWADAQEVDYRDNRYHAPGDEFDEKWDFTSGVQVAQLGFWLGWEAANALEMPTWKAGDEFMAARQRSLGK
ncbi:MAG TPA: M28 family peptidase [Thermoanaerobaculia bacterium]|nr:M28 family peptidase [Thermoanaerobaculia bacterium]